MAKLSASTFSKLAAALCLLVLGTNLYFLATLHSTHQSAAENQTRIHLLNQAVTSARETQVSFKNQVHEWKNILLRGQNPQDLEHYRQAFTANETLTRQKLETLVQDFTRADLGNLPADFLSAHQELGGLYRQGLDLYDSTDPATIFQVDRLVRGIDRKLNDQLDQLAATTELHVDTLIRQLEAAAAQSQAHHTLITWLCSGLTVLSVFAFTALALFRKTS